jgi:hypothetical protein
MKHRSSDIADAAAQILRSIGEEDAVAAKQEPVRFQIFINGSPIATDVSLDWSVYGQNGGYVSNVEKPDADGVIGIKREHFFDPERKPKAVVLQTGPAESAREPFLYARLPVPADLDSLTRVNVALHSVELKIYGTRQMLDDADRKATVVASTVNSSVEVQLRPGGDVHVEVVRPDGQRIPGDYLTKPNSKIELEYYQDENSTFRGLPCGDYVLHIRGSAERESQDPQFVDAVEYAGREIPFTISENSPSLIDLGEIHLDPTMK